MTKKLVAAAAIAVALLAPARADYFIKDGRGIEKTIKAGTIGSAILPYSTPTDATGVPYSAANPLAITFGAGVVLPSFGVPQHFICDSGCSGGGGGSGYTVTFGTPIGTLGTPGGFKDASGNFQALLGDTVNGQWVNVKASVPIPVTGTFWPYALGQQLAGASVPVVLTVAQQAALTPPTSVGITGTLPAFASTPTFNLGTLGGAATAANQATLISNQSATIGTLVGGTSATNSQLVGGVFNSAPITVTNTQQAALQIDGNGFLKVNVAAGGASGGTSSTFGASFPGTGTAAGMSVSGNMVALTGTGGNLNVQCANCSGSGASAVDNATFTVGSSVFAPAGGVFNDGLAAVTSGNQSMARITNNRAFHMNLRTAAGVETGIAAAPLQVSLANTGANATAIKVDGSAVTQPVNGAVTANLGTIAGVATQTTLAAIQTTLGSPFQAGGSIGNTTFGATQAVASALNATVVGTGTFAVQATIATATAWGINTLGSTTSGQSGQLALGAVTAAAPTYSTTQTNALSLTTTGDLRTVFSNSTLAVTNAGTFLVQSAQSGNWTSRTVGNAGAVLDFAGQNASSPANSILIGAQFNTSPTTVVSGNSSPLQMDNAGNLLVNIKAGAVSGAVAQGSTTSGQTGGLNQAAATTAAPTYITATTNPLSMDLSGNLRVSLITGFATAALQGTNTATTAHTCSVAGYSILGCLGQINDSLGGPIPQVTGPLNAATAVSTNSLTVGGQYLSSQPTMTTTQQAGLLLSARGELLVASGVSGFAVTIAGNQAVNVAQINGVTPLMGSGATGTGSQRTTTAVDTATIAGSAPGTAGTASANVLSVQGIASMFPVASNLSQVLGATMSATNGLFSNILQGNAVLSQTNPLFASITDGTNKAAVKPSSTPAAVTDAALAVAPIPSELHLGEIASNQIKVQVAQTVTASAYSAGNALGGLMTVANAARISGSAGAPGTGGILTGLQLNSKANQSAVQVDVFIFDANPTGSTCTDKTAFVLATADFDKVVGMLTIPAAQANGAGWFSGGTGSVGMPIYFPITYDLASSTSIYACAVVRGAITPASTSDVSFKFNTLRN